MNRETLVLELIVVVIVLPLLAAIVCLTYGLP